MKGSNHGPAIKIKAQSILFSYVSPDNPYSPFTDTVCMPSRMFENETCCSSTGVWSDFYTTL